MKVRQVVFCFSMVKTTFATINVKKCVGEFCCISLGEFVQGFSWRIFWGTFSHRYEKKQSCGKIRKELQRLKTNSEKNCSAQNPALTTWISCFPQLKLRQTINWCGQTVDIALKLKHSLQEDEAQNNQKTLSCYCFALVIRLLEMGV